MLPQGILSPTPQWALYMPPDDESSLITFTTDVQLGGIGLSDGNSGLEYQFWYLSVTDVGMSTSAVWVKSPNTPPTQIFAQSGIIWARLAFDQNMHPVISFMTSGNHSYLYWWDPTIPGNTTTALDSGVTYPAVTMDDKRATSTLVGSNDVILAYINNNNLCYRQERDRYGTEYVLYSNIQNLIVNPFVNKVGMNNNYYLQFQIGGQLYQ